MIHLVYPHGERRVAPWSIGNNLTTALTAAGYDVVNHDWTDTETITPNSTDILIGHPHPEPGRIFGNSLGGDWRRTIAMSPWGGLPLTEQMVDTVLPRVDKVALICGQTWAERVPARWAGKAFAVNMAIDRADYPRIKKTFRSPGNRNVLYVGCSAPAKGTQRLTALGALGVDIIHMGTGNIPGTYRAGYLDTTGDAARTVARQCDFLIAPGTNDANPTTVLEAASWGLLPMCTDGAGWGTDVCIRIPDDPEVMATVIRWYQTAPVDILDERRARIDVALGGYTWDNFCRAIVTLI